MLTPVRYSQIQLTLTIILSGAVLSIILGILFVPTYGIQFIVFYDWSVYLPRWDICCI